MYLTCVVVATSKAEYKHQKFSQNNPAIADSRAEEDLCNTYANTIKSQYGTPHGVRRGAGAPKP